MRLGELGVLQGAAQLLAVLLAGVGAGVLAALLEQRRVLAAQAFDLLAGLGEGDVLARASREGALLDADGLRRLGELALEALLEPQERSSASVGEEAADEDAVVR